MKHQFWLLAIVCSTVLADSMPEHGLATPAYIPQPVVATAPTYIPPVQTVYYNQPVYSQPATTYYNQAVYTPPQQQQRPVQMDRYTRFAIEREQMFGHSYIVR